MSRSTNAIDTHWEKVDCLIKQKKQSVPIEILDKYVGEQDASELAEALLDPKTRNVAQLTVSDVQEAAKLIECLLGTSVPPRREYLLKHSEEANEIE